MPLMNILKLTFTVLLVCSLNVHAERIKDLASVQGVRDNPLIGYGLIVGLNGTGDSTNTAPFTTQSLRSMLKRLGVTIPDTVSLQTKNTAAVTLHATLPAFIKPGQKIDVTVSSFANAESLKGGTLLMAPLRGIDNQIYAIAQGDILVGGFSASSGNGNSVSVNIPTAGRIPNGAIVEQGVPTPFENGGKLVLDLHTADYTTVERMVAAINKKFGPAIARALDGGSIAVNAPTYPSQKVPFVAALERLEITPGDPSARVVINSRTGTVIIGRHVKITASAVSHGNLTVTVKSSQEVSQPGAFSNGTTATSTQEEISIKEENNPMFVFDPGISLQDIVNAVNRVGASPSDLVAILEALKAAGALSAELIII